MEKDRKPQGMREAPATFVAAKDQRHEVLAGLVERVTFHSTETGFCVLRVKARGHRDQVTTVGRAAMISAGEWITASGIWINDRNHGLQFKAHFLKTSAPSTLEGIEKYLGSGMSRGIGPVYAKRLVKHFGKDVFEIIETYPERLLEVGGIGPVRAAKITAGWADQKAIREIMVFLQPLIYAKLTTLCNNFGGKYGRRLVTDGGSGYLGVVGVGSGGLPLAGMAHTESEGLIQQLFAQLAIYSFAISMLHGLPRSDMVLFCLRRTSPVLRLAGLHGSRFGV
jgi:hypothetical protein